MKKRRVRGAVNALRGQCKGKIYTDVLGSYTGQALDGGRPVQDADDL